jgi:hypothetical protein
MALQDPNVGPASVRVLSALRGSPESSCPPELLLRYEITFDRQFFRAHATKQPQPTTWSLRPARPGRMKMSRLRHEPQKWLKTHRADASCQLLSIHRFVALFPWPRIEKGPGPDLEQI